MECASETFPTPLRALVEAARVKHIPRDQIILYEGDFPSEVYILKEGAIKLHNIDADGNEKILHIVKPPALVPFAFFSSLSEPLRWFYTALTDCDVYVLPANELEQTTWNGNTLARELTCAFSLDMHELLVRLDSMSKTVVRDKVIAALKFLAVRHSHKHGAVWYRVDFPVSHQLIADLCGITRESAAKTMKDIRLEKLIRYPEITTLEIDLKGLGAL
jgi:CRP/FNR family transcriptional regulator